MARTETNARHYADARQRLDRACIALRDGVEGLLALDFSTENGVIQRITPNKIGPDWWDWIERHPLGTVFPPDVTAWPDQDRTHYAAAVLLLSQLFDRLSVPGVYGTGTLTLKGDGIRLFRPTADVRERLAAASAMAAST